MWRWGWGALLLTVAETVEVVTTTCADYQMGHEGAELVLSPSGTDLPLGAAECFRVCDGCDWVKRVATESFEACAVRETCCEALVAKRAGSGWQARGLKGPENQAQVLS